MTKKRKNGTKAGGKDVITGTYASTSSSSKFSSSPFDSFPLNLVSNTHWNFSKAKDTRIQELVPGRVLVVPGFFTPKECQEWVSFCEGSGVGAFEYTAHPATKFVAHRECYRMQQENATALARRIYERLQSFTVLPMVQREMNSLYQIGAQDNSYEPVGCNPNLRLYKYGKGHSFGKHVDGSNLVAGMGKTEWTILVYLTECQGGATRFYSEHRKRKSPASSVAFEPQVGAILLHLHGDFCLEHEADAVLGGTKYVLRTDLVFATEEG